MEIKTLEIANRRVVNSPRKMEGGEECLQSFVGWATKLGITDSPTLSSSSSSSCLCLGQSLQLSHFPEAGGRGLAAARDLNKNELILRVPNSALMTTGSLTAKDHKLATSVAKHTYLSSTQVLSVCLLGEMNKGKNSWWHPYLMQMPRGYDTLANFTKFEAQALQVEDAIWLAERVTAKAESDWEQALPLMRELNFRPQLLTFKWWLWASATVSSRTMHVPWDAAGCLCPVGDFFNYAAPGHEPFCFEEEKDCQILQKKPLCGNKVANEKGDIKQLNDRLTDAGYEEGTGAYCFYARKSYRKGEQVLLSYGTYPNLELLEHYGFHLIVNPNEKVFIPLDSGIYADSWLKDSLYIQWDGMPSFSLLSALRLWATPQNRRKSVSHLVHSGAQLSAENEIVVLKWLLMKCLALLDRLPSSLEQDVVLLNSIGNLYNNCDARVVEQMLLACGDELGAFFEANNFQKGYNVVEFACSRKVRRSLERWKLAVQWRLGYKQVLAHCIKYCNETIAVLSSPQLSCTGVITI